MAENIFVAVIAIVVIGAGVFCWWIDNGGNKKQKKEDTKEDNV